MAFAKITVVTMISHDTSTFVKGSNSPIAGPMYLHINKFDTKISIDRTCAHLSESLFTGLDYWTGLQDPAIFSVGEKLTMLTIVGHETLEDE